MSGTVTTGRRTFKDTAGANTYNIGADATRVTIAGKMTAGDIINLEGLASEYTASAAGRTITLKSATQTVTFQLSNTAGTASVRFLDGDLTAAFATKGGATLGTQKLSRKAVDVNDAALGANDSTAVDFTGSTSSSGSSSGGSSSGGSSSGTTGSTFTLTTGVDTPAYTSGNDTIIAIAGTGATMGAADQLDAGAGNDTLKIYSDGAVTLPATVANVENIWINDTEHQTYTLNTLTGLTSFELDSGTSNAANADSTITIASGQSLIFDSITDGDAADDAAANGAFLIASANAAVTSLDITVDGVGAQTDATASALTDLDFDVTGTAVATVTLNTVGTNNISLANAGGAIATLNIKGSGDTTIWGTTAATITSYTNSGIGNVTIDLSGSTGASQTITGGSGNDSITVDLQRNISLTGGDGNDVITLTNATAANLTSTSGASDVINAGAGSADTLVLTAAGADALDSDAAADRAVITGFERLRISDTLNGVTVDASAISGGVNYIQLTADTITANGTITGVTSGATIENRSNTHAGSTITIAATTLLAAETVSATVNGTTITYTLTAGDVAGNAAADLAAAALGLATAINTSQGAGTASAALGVITLANNIATAVADTSADAGTVLTIAAGDAIETDITMTGASSAGTPDDLLNIILNGDITNNDDVESAYGVSGINKLVFTTADRDNTDGATDRNDGYIVNLTNDNSVSLMTISGTSAFGFTSTASTASLATVNASALSGDLSINLATNGLTQGVSVTGGSGTNTIVGTGFGDVIVGGARADSITLGAGADVVTGGAGADTFVLATANYTAASSAALAAAADTITDFGKASDILNWGSTFTIQTSATASVGVAAVNAEGIATFIADDDTLAERITAAAASTNSDGDFVVFTFGSDSYVYINSNADSAVSAGDALVKLTGVSGLVDSTIATTSLTIA